MVPKEQPASQSPEQTPDASNNTVLLHSSVADAWLLLAAGQDSWEHIGNISQVFGFCLVSAFFGFVSFWFFHQGTMSIE